MQSFSCWLKNQWLRHNFLLYLLKYVPHVGGSKLSLILLTNRKATHPGRNIEIVGLFDGINQSLMLQFCTGMLEILNWFIMWPTRIQPLWELCNTRFSFISWWFVPILLHFIPWTIKWFWRSYSKYKRSDDTWD